MIKNLLLVCWHWLVGLGFFIKKELQVVLSGV